MTKVSIRILALVLSVLAALAHSEVTSPVTERSESRYKDIVDQKDRLDTLLNLIEQRQNVQVFELAELWVADLEGETWFDFYYGLSAIETAHYDEALFAFERLVIRHSNQTRYRLELARTHFYLRNLIQSKYEFETVLQQNPPEPVQQNVHKFLRSIANLQASIRPKLSASFSTATGYDSNINSATRDKTLPKEELIFPVDIILNDESRQSGSIYWSNNMNVFYSKPINKSQQYDLRAVYSKRNNEKTDTYNLDSLMTEAGYSLQQNTLNWRGAIRYQLLHLNTQKFLESYTLTGQVQWRTAYSYIAGLSMNYGLSQYANNSSNNTNTKSINLSLASEPKKHNWLSSISFTQDSAEHDSHDFIGKDQLALNFQLNSMWKNRITSTALVSFNHNKHHDINGAFYTKKRIDKITTVAAGLYYDINSHLNIHNNYSYSDNLGSLSANTFTKGKVEFGLNYSF